MNWIHALVIIGRILLRWIRMRCYIGIGAMSEFVPSQLPSTGGGDIDVRFVPNCSARCSGSFTRND